MRLNIQLVKKRAQIWTETTAATCLVSVWRVGNIDTKNPDTVQINGHYGYISIVYVDENLTKIEAVVIYGMCTRDPPEGIWDFLIVI